MQHAPYTYQTLTRSLSLGEGSKKNRCYIFVISVLFLSITTLNFRLIIHRGYYKEKIMNLTLHLIKSAKPFLENIKDLKYIGTSAPIRTNADTILNFRKGIAGVAPDRFPLPKTVKYRIKPDITMPINPGTLYQDNPAFKLPWTELKAKNELALGELGNVSLRLAKKYEQALPNAKKEINEIFEGFDISVRSKGANSVYSKLERMTIKGKKIIKTDDDARKIIQDAIGGRITLKNLTQQDVLDTINSIKIDGKNLSQKEKQLVQRLFANEKLTDVELETAQKLAKPIKLALAEKHSAPAVRKFMLSGIKDALNRNLTTIEKLEQAGISKDLIEEICTNPKIRPLKMTEINNYKGADGIAYFSDRQIREFEKLQLATGEKFDIITCSENIDLSKYGIDTLPKSAQDAIKKSGYTTGQINVELSDGTLAEIQVRGSGPFGEYEHLKYDASQGKNTLGEIYQPYVKKVQNLSDADNVEYDTYVSKTYDYYRDPELGITSSKPQLPKRFDPILSEESMKHLHELDQIDQANKMKTFTPHIEIPGGKKEFVV